MFAKCSDDSTSSFQDLSLFELSILGYGQYSIGRRDKKSCFIEQKC